MILSEEEALTKRCQESFGDGWTVPDGWLVTGAPAIRAQVASPSHCIGSGCMAWRWATLIENGSLVEIAGPRTGYCGKAGDP